MGMIVELTCWLLIIGFFTWIWLEAGLEQQECFRQRTPATEFIIREDVEEDDSFVYTSMWLDID